MGGGVETLLCGRRTGRFDFGVESSFAFGHRVG